MRLPFRLHRCWRNFLASAVLIALAASGLQAQTPPAAPAPPASTYQQPPDSTSDAAPRDPR